jgi:hypothetical protein
MRGGVLCRALLFLRTRKAAVAKIWLPDSAGLSRPETAEGLRENRTRRHGNSIGIAQWRSCTHLMHLLVGIGSLRASIGLQECSLGVRQWRRTAGLFHSSPVSRVD